MTSASVVIPAHNEAAVIDRCLTALRGADLHVVVVANGCVDDTAARARRLGVHTVELSAASKIAALNAGDEACADCFPRLYLDADVVLTADDATRVVRFLTASADPVVCAPQIVFDTSRASIAVRAFYRAYRELPYIQQGMIGSGVYAVNGAGRRRWSQFPELTNDDLFVQGLFGSGERVVVSNTSFCVVVPLTVRGLLRVRTRIYQGNREAVGQQLAGSMSDSRERSLQSLVRLVRFRPRLAGPVAVYLAVNVVAAARARWRGASGSWLTDDTSRSG